MSVKRVLEILHQLLEQRNYTIQESDDENMIFALKPNNERMCVFLDFMEQTEKFNVKNYKYCFGKMGTLNIDHSIIIHNSITPNTKQYLVEELGKKIECFDMKELMYNPTKHRLTPPHRRLTEEEAVIFDKKERKNLPVIKKDDVISRFYGYEKGDIIEITRPDIVVFRIVR